MFNIFYGCSIIMAAFWSIGFFVYKAGHWIHIFLVIALISIFLSIMQGKNQVYFFDKAEIKK